MSEMLDPILHTIDPETFQKLQSLLTSSQGVVWLTRGGAVQAQKPLFAVHQGLLRTLRLEDASKRLISLDFDSSQTPCMDSEIDLIVEVLTRSFDQNMNQADLDVEYAVKDSMLYVPRVYHDTVENKAISKTPADPQLVLTSFHHPDQDISLHIAIPGLLNSLRFNSCKAITLEVPAGFVEIKPMAFGLNFRDVLIALGQLDETIMGYECSGIVTRLGMDTSRSGLRIGDRVCAVLKGHFKNRVQTRWTSVGRIPEEMSYEQAASFPVVAITAYYSLYDIARLERSESILIHAGTGGVGQVAIMLAQHIGADIFVTCGTESKRKFLIDTYNIPAHRILSSRNPSFASGIMAMTNGKGVDVILNSLAGPLLRASWDCIARFGRFIEIGKADGEAARRLDMTPFTRAVTISAVDVHQLGLLKGEVAYRVLADCLRLYRERVWSTVSPITSYSISQVESSFRHMQSGTHIGKIVIISSPDDQVMVSIKI